MNSVGFNPFPDCHLDCFNNYTYQAANFAPIEVFPDLFKDGMRTATVLSLVLLLSGCFPSRERFLTTENAWLKKPANGMDETKTIRMDIALVKIPAGELEMASNIWHLADENLVPLDRKSTIQSNGFKIANFGKNPPPELLRLLTNEKYCSNPRRLHVSHGSRGMIPVAGVMEPFQCTVLENGEKRSVELPAALGWFQANAIIAGEESYQLSLVPIVRSADSHLGPKATKNASGNIDWEIQTVRKEEIFSRLFMNVNVQAGDFLVLGCTEIRDPDTSLLGSQLFLEKNNQDLIPRLLVIRCSQKAPSPKESLNQFGKALPLAIQASWKNLALEP